MTEAKPAYRSVLRCLVSGSPVWCTFSRVLQCSRPLPCMSQSGQGIGGLLVVYHPIFERDDAEVRIVTTAMVAGLVAEMDDDEVAPSLRSSAGGTDT